MHVSCCTSIEQTISLHVLISLHDYMCKGVLCGLSACIGGIVYCIHPYTGMECVPNAPYTMYIIHCLRIVYD